MFASPWADAPCRPQDVGMFLISSTITFEYSCISPIIDYNVPQEYLIHPFIRDKVPTSRHVLS